MSYILVFFAVILVDLAWVLYIRWTSQGKKLIASTVASLLYLFSAYVVISYTKDIYTLVPATLGAFIGTYIGILLDSKDRK